MSRKPMGVIRKSTHLTKEHWAKAAQIGSGNATRGIRLALDSMDNVQYEIPHIHSTIKFDHRYMKMDCPNCGKAWHKS